MVRGSISGGIVTGKTLVANRWASLILCSICGMLALSTWSFASDLKIVTKMHSGAADSPSSTTTRYYQGSRFRTDWRDTVGESVPPGKEIKYKFGHGRAMIQQCDAHRSFMVDLDAHEYTSTELDESGVPKGSTRPFHRDTTANNSARPTEQIFIDNVDTGERKEMFGHTARHIITKQRREPGIGASGRPSSTETDGWYIDLDVPMGTCSVLLQRAYGTGRVATAYAVLAGGSSGLAGGSSAIPKVEVHRTGVTDLGFAVKSTFVSHFPLGSNNSTPTEHTSTSELEVAEISDAPLDPALFEVPEGFKLVERLSSQFSAMPATVDPK